MIPYTYFVHNNTIYRCRVNENGMCDTNNAEPVIMVPIQQVAQDTEQLSLF
jgi:hypothetical protein